MANVLVLGSLFLICLFEYLGGDKSAEDILRERFAAKNSNIDAFSSIR